MKKEISKVIENDYYKLELKKPSDVGAVMVAVSIKEDKGDFGVCSAEGYGTYLASATEMQISNFIEALLKGGFTVKRLVDLLEEINKNAFERAIDVISVESKEQEVEK